jgi:hypothetical protein
MHFWSINATIMLLSAPLVEFELLVDFELLTTWIARGDFVPPSVTAQSELPVLHYISSCCFYGGLVEPVQLLHFLSEWASNSLLSEWASIVDGGKVRSWICVNLARNVQDSVVRGFCHALALMCQASGKDFAWEPVLPPLYARPDQVERALTVRYHDAMHVLGPQHKELDLLIGILPDNLFQFVRNTPLSIDMSRHAHLQFWQQSEVMLLCWKRWLKLL